MRIKNVFTLFLFVQFLISCQENEVQKVEVQIIPEPLSQKINEGFFELGNVTGINYPEELKVSAEFLKSFIEQGTTIKLREGNDIRFSVDASIDNDEGYTLQISPEAIEIKAKTDQGAFYAVQSLRQLLPAAFETGRFNKNTVRIPSVSIADAPQFVYRGMHLDVGRHLFSVDFVKKYIDAIALLKMNTFHWHLTEDQGWRIEIKKYPKLQEVAAYRNETIIGHYSNQPQQFDGKPYGGFYTQEEVKDIVAYAGERFVTVIPEIEMPGHSQAAIAAYPELGCTGEQVEVATKWGVFEDIYCTKEETFAFLEDVLDEVLDLFPSEYIHIGGDEAPKTRWKTCSYCQQKIKAEGLKDEHELQNYFITRMEKYLNSKGRQIIGWDEILEGGLAPNATVMSWRGTRGAVEAAKSGHNVVMTPNSHCYFDHYQSLNEDEPTAIGGYLPLEKVYGFNPIPEELTKEEATYVLGAQGNVWTEYMPTEAQVEYMAFPRMLAMSEVLWSTPENKNYQDFVMRLETFQERLDTLNVNYAMHLYELSGHLQKEGGDLSYTLETLFEDRPIRYTLDGTEPTYTSNLHQGPIKLTNTISIKAALFENEKRLGPVFSETRNFHKAVGAKISVSEESKPANSSNGVDILINGIYSDDSKINDRELLGFSGDTIELTIDLGEPMSITSIDLKFANRQIFTVYHPESIEVEIDGNKQQYVFNPSVEEIIKAHIDVQGVSSYIKLLIKNYGTIPLDKQGAGKKSWTVMGEIIVN